MLWSAPVTCRQWNPSDLLSTFSFRYLVCFKRERLESRSERAHISQVEGGGTPGSGTTPAWAGCGVCWRQIQVRSVMDVFSWAKPRRANHGLSLIAGLNNYFSGHLLPHQIFSKMSIYLVILFRGIYTWGSKYDL